MRFSFAPALQSLSQPALLARHAALMGWLSPAALASVTMADEHKTLINSAPKRPEFAAGSIDPGLVHSIRFALEVSIHTLLWLV